MSSSKIIYLVAALIVIVGAVFFIVKTRQNQAAQDQQLAAQNSSPSTNSPDLSLNGNQQNTPSSPTQAPTTTTPAAQTPTQTPAPAQKVVGCPKGQDVTQTDSRGRFLPTLDIANKTVTLQTTMGNIQIQLYDKDAPKTVENFVCLVQQGYYNKVTFHRVAHGFVIQSGDPTGTGSGGTSVYGGKFEDELYTDTASYKAGYLKGVLAMANTGQPGTNTSQFFILLSDRPDLPKQYTIFGKVSAGQDVVDKIGQLPVTPQLGPEDGKPTTTVTITKATVK